MLRKNYNIILIIAIKFNAINKIELKNTLMTRIPVKFDFFELF